MSRYALLISVIAVFVAANVQAAPLSVIIDEFDFTFDTDFVATYAYNGNQADTLTVGAGGNEVGSYRYLGTAGPTDPLGNSQGFYPVWDAGGIYGGDLELTLNFDTNDGPYTSGGDQMDISLTGTGGSLKITGSIGATGNSMILLEIDFRCSSLLGRQDEDVIDLIEAEGMVKTIFGEEPSYWGYTNLEGVTFMKFFSDGPDIFPNPPGATYDPLGTDFGVNDYVTGRVSGEAGVPEPATLVLLGLGGVGLLLRRRRR